MQQKASTLERLLTVGEAASVLRVHTRTLRRLMARNQLPRVRIGRRTLVREASLTSFIREREGWARGGARCSTRCR